MNRPQSVSSTAVRECVASSSPVAVFGDCPHVASQLSRSGARAAHKPAITRKIIAPIAWFDTAGEPAQ